MRYEVEVLPLAYITATVSAKRLQDLLNERAANGWKLTFMFKDVRRSMPFTRRKSHFLIFERAD